MKTECIETIRSNEDGEAVRSAIIEIAEDLNKSYVPIVTFESYDEFNALSDEEKNNGTIYMISDVEIEDGDSKYYGTA